MDNNEGSFGKEEMSSEREHDVGDCPYIKRVRETSQKYKEIIQRLHLLAKYNEEIKGVLSGNVDTSEDGFAQALVRRNRDLRIYIKTNLCEEKDGKENRKTNKRELKKIKDTLLEENERLLFEIKKKY